MTVRDMMIKLINHRLTHFKGNKIRTARSLGLHIRTLRNWVKNEVELREWYIEYGTKPEYRPRPAEYKPEEECYLCGKSEGVLLDCRDGTYVHNNWCELSE